MCLIVFAWKAHPDYPLILASNRDEFYNRPTLEAHRWPDHKTIYGGRDELAKGTWLAVNDEKKLAAVTNYRDLSNINPKARSRGELPVDFLIGKMEGMEYLQAVDKKANQYNGFNLLTFTDEEALHYSNYEKKINLLKPGIYGLSNAVLDTPWPKVLRAKAKFEQIISTHFEHKELLDLMHDQWLAPDEDLPPTGLSYEKEKALSAMCIRTEGYGTCCSTIVTKNVNGNLKFTEESYPVGARKGKMITTEFE
ncbi:MAG: NRDE family protein [Cyclobacteriaceae bacterium]